MAGEAVPVDDLPSATAVPAHDLPEGYQPPSKALIQRQAGALGRKAAGRAALIIGQKDPDVDYSGVPDASAQAAYSLIPKPEDRTRYLEGKYGKDAVSKDTYGRDVVTIGGKKIGFLPREEGKNVAAQYGALAGDVLPTAGMVAGGTLGAAGGPLGAIGGSALGGGAGVAANQLIARGMGLPMSQGPGETAGQIATEGAIPGALGGAAGEVVGLAGRTALGPWQPGSLFGPWSRNVARWQEQMRDTELARSYGLRPHIGAAQPQATITARAQAMTQRVFGDELPQLNRPVLEKNVNALTGEAAGAPVEPRLKSPEELNKQLGYRADMKVGRAEYDAIKARDEAEKIISSAKERLTSDIGTPSGQLAGKVSQDIRAARADFGAKAQELYKPIDELAGQPIVPTKGLKDALKKVVDENPLTKPSEVFAKSINDLPEKVTFQQMQAIRSTLYSRTDAAALNPGLSDRQVGTLASAANKSFDLAAADPAAKGATLALRRADQFYKAGIKRFEDMTSQALVKDATQSGFVEPEKVARYIATPGQTDKLLRIKKVITPEAFADVGKQTWSNILRDSTDPLTGQVDGKRLSKTLFDYSKNRTLDVLYGEQAPQMRRLAAQYAALDGKVSVDALERGDARTAIEQAIKTEERFKSLDTAQWVKSVRTEGPQSLQAADWLTRPDNRLQLRNAIKELGPDSKESVALKEYLARRIFGSMERPASELPGAEKYALGGTILRGKPLQDMLNSYGKEYLDEVFGKEWTEKTYRFAKAAEVATRGNPTDSGGLVASFVALHPLKHVGTLAGIFAKGEILASPAFIDYASKGVLKGDMGQFVRDISMLGTRGVIDYGVERGQRTGTEYARGVKNKVQSELTPGR